MKRMTTERTIALMLCLFMLTGCTGLGKRERKFAVSQGMSADSTLQLADFSVPEACGLETMKEDCVLSNVPQTISSPFGDESAFAYEQSDCKFRDDKKEEYGSFYAVYDQYRNKNGDEVEMLHGTDIIGFYSKGESSDAGIGSGGSFIDETKAVTVAKEFLKSILPERYVDSLTYYNTEYDGRFYAVFFGTEIEGYKTDDDQVVWVDNYGATDGYHGYDAMKYETLKDDITVEKLDAAKAALKEKLATDNFSEVSMGDPQIVTNTEGDLYLSVPCSYTGEDGTTGTFLAYTNIL